MIPRDDIEEKTLAAIHSLIQQWGGDPTSFDGSLITQLIQSSLKLIHRPAPAPVPGPAPPPATPGTAGTPETYNTGPIKLITAALKEMRYAYRVFNKYRGIRKITIFGSARTAPDHPDYHAAKEFSARIAQHAWMAITGAGLGIMKAGHEG